MADLRDENDLVGQLDRLQHGPLVACRLEDAPRARRRAPCRQARM